MKNERNEAIHGDDQVDGIHGRSLVTEKTSEAHCQAVQKIATAFQKSVAVTSGKVQVFSENVLLCSTNETGMKKTGFHQISWSFAMMRI